LKLSVSYYKKGSFSCYKAIKIKLQLNFKSLGAMCTKSNVLIYTCVCNGAIYACVCVSVRLSAYDAFVDG